MDRAFHPTVGCTASSAATAVAAARALASAGAFDVRIGATDRHRAQDVAREAGASVVADPADPLAGSPGLVTPERAAASVNAGALAGAVLGAVAGGFASMTSFGELLPVVESARPIAGSLVFLAVGAAVGGVLGGAFGRRPSTHAGFRLIDAADEGAIVIVAGVAEGDLEAARRALEGAGVDEVVVIEPGRS